MTADFIFSVLATLSPTMNHELCLYRIFFNIEYFKCERAIYFIHSQVITYDVLVNCISRAYILWVLIFRRSRVLLIGTICTNCFETASIYLPTCVTLTFMFNHYYRDLFHIFFKFTFVWLASASAAYH